MRRIALCLLTLTLVLPFVGCKKEEPAATPPADGAAAPADDAAEKPAE